MIDIFILSINKITQLFYYSRHTTTLQHYPAHAPCIHSYLDHKKNRIFEINLNLT